jgi:hypothetical protein
MPKARATCGPRRTTARIADAHSPSTPPGVVQLAGRFFPSCHVRWFRTEGHSAAMTL